jgi:hypothetical protein
LLAFFSSALADDCGDLVGLSLRARALMLEGREEDASAHMDRAQDAMACGDLRSPEDLSQFYLSEATRRFLSDDPMAAGVAFVASWRLDPANWDPALGEEMKQLYDQSVADAMSASNQTGEILLAELPRGYRGALNGIPADFPITAPAGEHLVQVYHHRTVSFGDMAYLTAGESIQINPGELPPIQRPLYLIGSGVSALLAGGMAVIAVRQSETMATATDLGSLDRAHTVQRIAAFSSYSLCGLSATGLVLHLVR